MPSEPARSAAQRKADTIAKLQATEADAWIATATVDGDTAAQGYLVPLSLAWIDERIVLALEPRSRTARNFTSSDQTRLALGHSRDVVMIDAVIEASVASSDLDDATGDRYAAQSGWDPRRESIPFVYVTLRPVRIQAWREANELAGRTLMKNGVWTI